MRRLIFRPLVLLLTFLTGLFVTFLLTYAGDVLARLLDEPSDSIPALCRSEPADRSAFCSQTTMQESEEAAVCSALVEQMSIDDLGSMVVVQNQTVRADQFPIDYSEDSTRIFDALELYFPQAEQETLASFRANNEQSWPLKNPFLLQIKSLLISRQEIEGHSTQPGIWWEAFYRKYPGATGFLMLSKVGFNREMNQALVYRAFICGDTCGYGSYLFLVKEDGVWSVRGQAGQWVS